MEKRGMPTINDIARIVGVSKSTVSRALNDSPLIGEETRRRVRAVAEELQFSINVSAQRLSRQSSRTIANGTQCNDAD